jgi:tetraacyldisaccharide 4'-kinase
MNRAATIALVPLSALYGALVRSGNALYQRSVFRRHKVAAPVVSVGNLTTGGTGKTPLVEWIARELAGGGRRVCILTRGYRRESTGRLVVSDGKEILADISRAGDEALLLAENLRGKAAVVCDADRVQGAKWAIENLASDVFVLDDGFQHQRIARELNIVTIDATNAWGNGMLLPAGILREPRTALSRADCVVITRADDSDQSERVYDQIQALVPAATIFRSRMEATGVLAVNALASVTTIGDLTSLPAAACCAIGNSESFFSLLRRNGFELKSTRAFRDHYKYAPADAERIVEAARAQDAQILLTTAKDAVKLRDLNLTLPCYAVEIQIQIEQADDFRKLIFKAVGQN